MLSFFKRKKPDYQNTLEWAPNRQVLLLWDIKLIAHDWVTPTIFFTVSLSALIIPFIVALFWLSPLTTIESTWFGIGLYSVVAAFILLQVRVKNQFIYRLSNTGIEYHRWRVYPEFSFSGVKAMLVFIGIASVLAGIFAKQGVLIIAGPVSIAIAAFVRVGSSDYKKWAVNSAKEGAPWSDIIRMQYDPKQRLVRLNYHFDISQEEIKRIMEITGSVGVMTEGEYDIFLTQDNEQQALSILQHQLPNIPLETTRLKLPEVV